MTAGELLDIILPRLSSGKAQNLAFIDAVQTTAEIITRRLWLKRSDLLKQDFEKALAEDSASVTLDADFLGMAENSQPWLDYGEGRKQVLAPLPSGMKHTFSDSGLPLYYQLRGFTLSVFPTASEASALKGEMYARPAAVTALDDNLPFDGIFDRLFIDAVLIVGRESGAVTVNQAFAAMLYDQVDSIIHARPAKSITWRHPG